MSEDLLKNNPMHNTNMYAEGELPTPQPGDLSDYGTGHRPGELVMQQLLQFAFQSIRNMLNDPTTNYQFNQIFTFFETERLNAFKKWFAATKFEVLANFPKHDYPLPIVALHSREEQEPEANLLGGHEMIKRNKKNDEFTTSTELAGQFVDQTLDTIIITDDPVTTIMLYRLVWYIIFANRLELEAFADFHEQTMSGGAAQFDAQSFPNWQYSRILTLKYKCLFDFALHDMRAPMAVRLSALFKVGEFAAQSADPNGLIVEEE